MNSFERFNAILDGKKPDRMPFFFPTIACSVASEILGREAHTGGDSLHFKEEKSWLYGEQAHAEFVQKYQEDSLELHKRLGADIIRETWRCRAKPTKMLDEYTLLFGDENGPHTIKRFYPETQSYGVVKKVGEPQDGEELIERLKKSMKHDYDLTDDILEERFKDQLRMKKMAEPYFPMIATGLGIGFPMDSVAWLEASAIDPLFLRDYFLFHAEKEVKIVKFLVNKGFRFISGGADIATAKGPVMSPKNFRTIFEPTLKLFADECRKYGAVFCYRTDGDIWEIADCLFKDAGVQAYGEVDRAASMTVGKLREKYPDLIILGNISSATLVEGTTEDVRRETRATLEESGGYRYIPGPSNAIVHGTPVENVYAMIDEIKNYKP